MWRLEDLLLHVKVVNLLNGHLQDGEAGNGI